ncbi:type II toxin-antitoxin system Phd/YefM family antitoxin [Sorangium sp. So ce388]|uniref:type II toxin-antitoxin system Phd/YefM family antitoxin n=1 Tax=Sorangium sp. So ce388 TaxID=3133309 RepID=UPI003F5CB832
MKTIGVRELRQRASVVLREVENGETFEVTDRGRPVAVLSPVADKSPLDRLRASGDVSVPTGKLDDLPPPLTLAPGQTPPSIALARLRKDER